MTAALLASRLQRRHRKGLTLFGALMALTLFAGAVIGAVTLYNTAQENQDRNDAQALLTTLTVAVKQIHQGAPTYGTGSLVGLLEQRGAIPAGARQTTDTTTTTGGVTTTTTTVSIGHPFGSNVTVVGAGTGFEITFNGLERENCAMMLDPYAGQRPGGGGLQGVEVGGTDIPLPMTPASIGTACTAASNNVEFQFE